MTTTERPLQFLPHLRDVTKTRKRFEEREKHERVRVKMMRAYGPLDDSWVRAVEQFTDDQYRVLLRLILVDCGDPADRVIVVTGVAGSGKSHLIKFYIDYLKKCNALGLHDELHDATRCIGNCEKGVVVAAPTGVAAVCVNGVTLDRHFGGYSSVRRTTRMYKETGDDIQYDVEASYAKFAPYLAGETLRYASTTVVDECFMVQGPITMVILHGLRTVPCSRVRFFGDPYQLLPCYSKPGWGRDLNYFVVACRWPRIELEHIIRTENKLLRMLILLLREVIRQESSLADLDEYSKDLLHKISLAQDGDSFAKIKTEKMIVCYKNCENMIYNHKYLSDLPGRPRLYDAVSAGDQSPEAKNFLYNLLLENKFSVEHRFQPRLLVKRGAHVMTTRNHDHYKNGMIGEVVGLDDDHISINFFASHSSVNNPVKVPRLEYDMLDSRADKFRKIKQFPVMLAYSITVYKTQGITCDVPIMLCPDSHIDMRCLYVVISRVRSIRHLYFNRPLCSEYFPRCFSPRKKISGTKRKRDDKDGDKGVAKLAPLLSFKSFCKK